MTRVAWDTPGKRRYETGVDRGVFYLPGDEGVPWNGLVSVEETVSGGESSSFYFDGVKYLDTVSYEDFQAVISAYTYPNKFQQCDGTALLADGLFATQQPRQRFNLCYRTMFGDDLSGLQNGYKIHLVYNALASPSGRMNASINSDPEAINFQWQINTVPVMSSTYKPTSHFIIDSTRILDDALAGLEDILYGNDTLDPAFPDQADIIDLISNSFITEPIGEPI